MYGALYVKLRRAKPVLIRVIRVMSSRLQQADLNRLCGWSRSWSQLG